MSLLETQRALEEAARRTGPAVIGLRRGARRGSGLLVGDDRAITLARNLRDDQLTVALHDGNEVSARVLGTDREVDLALLALDAAAGGQPLQLTEDGAAETAVGTAPGRGGRPAALCPAPALGRGAARARWPARACGRAGLGGRPGRTGARRLDRVRRRATGGVDRRPLPGAGRCARRRHGGAHVPARDRRA